MSTYVRKTKSFIYALIICLLLVSRGELQPAQANQNEESHTSASIPVAAATVSPEYRYTDTFGTTGEAYLSSTSYLNRPAGLFMDGSDNLYVTEEMGCRILKYSSSGTHLLSIGTAGLCYTDDYILSGPYDVALDSGGNLWVADQKSRVVQYDASGNFLQNLPDTDPWETGTDNSHFNSPVSVAFDSAGRMFVSDQYNHRVQVYTFSAGVPVFSATLGETGVSGSDSSHFDEPTRIAVDSSDRLFVVDRNNGRVQLCEETTGWSCTSYLSGLSTPYGIGLDSSDNAYIADSGNYRLLKCTAAETCTELITGLTGWVVDAVVDSSGNIFIADWTNHVVRKYDSGGNPLGVFIGTEPIAYAVDTARYNKPSGIIVDLTGNIYFTEENGYRLIKLTSSGIQDWTVGEASVFGNDNAHFGDFWAGPRGGLALDSTGQVYAPDTGNHRIQVFDSSGVYVDTFGSLGSGDLEFDSPEGVAINPTNGDIFVVDVNNHRVQVYSSTWVYKATLGTTGVPGADGTHFDAPRGIAVTAGGVVYVSDTGNHRVQECIIIGSSGTCTTFVGQTGVAGDEFDTLNSPRGLALDSLGQLYVADLGNNRLQIFDSLGGYLTTIGGEWGQRSAQFRDITDVALDTSGNIYVTDSTNFRIQKFSPGVPDWDQINVNGFGEKHNQAIHALTAFGGNLYAAARNGQGNGPQIWRLNGSWTPMMTDGFGNPANVAIDDLGVFDNQLYAGTWNSAAGGEIWRSVDGVEWIQVVTEGFGDSSNEEIIQFVTFNSQIYAGTVNDSQGAEIWQSSTGDDGGWSRVVDDGFGDTGNIGVMSFEIHNGNLFGGTNNVATGGEIWYSADGTTWDQINTNGFGDAGNRIISALASYGDYLYAITQHSAGAGSEIWRCQVCDGGDWEQVVNNGFGNPDTRSMPAMEIYNGQLYAIVGNVITGLEVWRTPDGTTWSQFGFAGFGDSNNTRPYWDNSIAVNNNTLYIGTLNWANGGEVWSYIDAICYPLTLSTVGNGTITPNPTESSGCLTGEYFEDELIELNAVPDPGWSFDSWTNTDDDLVTSTTNYITMPGSAHTVTATFTQDEYVVTVSTVGSGSVINSPGNPYYYGETATLQPFSVPGWSFAGWSGANSGELSDNGNGTWDLLMDGNKAVTATFTQVEYSVTVSTVGSGSVTNTPGNPYNYGETATLEPLPDPGWTFAGWSGANSGELSDNGNGTWDLLMDGNKAVTATFTQDEYTVTVSTVGSGSVTNTPGNPYVYGETATLEPLPDPGWSFAGWSGADAGDLSDNGNDTWDLLMDGNKAVTATFTQDEYTVTVSTIGSGSVTNTPGNTYLYGETATLEPLPDTGWSFAGWSGADAGDLSDNGNGTWDLLIDGNKAVTATFIKNSLSLFWDDFETGDFSRWTRYNDGGGWLYACTKGAINGSWGACVQRGTNDRRKQLIDETPVDKTTFNVRFNFDPHGISMLEGERFRFMQTKLLTVRPYFMVMKYLGGKYLIQLRVRQDNGIYLKTAWVVLSDAPHTIEVDWMAATGPGNNDGYGEFWIDGIHVESLLGLDNDTMYVDTFKIGFTSRLEGKSISGIFFLDDVATSDMGFIGLP